jgi:hypothetical protein
MQIRLSPEIRDTIIEWGWTVPQAAVKCINEYNRKEWELKRKRGPSVSMPVPIAEETLGTLLGWQVRAIIEDHVGRTRKAYEKQFKPVDLDPADVKEMEQKRYAGVYQYQHPGLNYVLQEQD